MASSEHVECMSCGSNKAMLVYEPKYKGFRGRCPICDGEWPES